MADPAHDIRDNVARMNFEPARSKRSGSILSAATAQPDRSPAAAAVSPAAKPHRVVSIDALRGFNMFWIIGGDGLTWSLQDMLSHQGAVLSTFGNFAGLEMNHVQWEGFRFYDFIFPLFVFVTGVAIPFSLTRLVEREGAANAYKRLLRRFVLLFVLGILYYGGMSHKWPDIRLLGVLQRIAICYLAASVLFLNFRVRGLIVAVDRAAGRLLGADDLRSGAMDRCRFLRRGSQSRQLDRSALSAGQLVEHHLGSRRSPEYPAGDRDLSARGPCRHVVKSDAVAPQQKSLWLIGGGVLMVLAGHLWGLQFPVIKSIWTSSFVLVAGGYSAMLLGVMYQVIDVWEFRAWATAFVWIGANAITLYFLNNVASFWKFAKRFVGGDVAVFLDHAIAPGTADFAANVVGLGIAIALAGYLYRHKIFLRV